MIGAISYKITNEYVVRIYSVGSYNQIDWNNGQSCLLGENYTVFPLKDAECQSSNIIIADGIDGKRSLRFLETKRYILKISSDSETEIELPHFQNENNKFLKLEKDRDSVTFQFINYLGKSRITFASNNEPKELVFEVIPEKMDYEEDYIKLTESLAQICAELLLEHTGATSNTFKQSDETSKTILEQFIFLRQFCYSQNLYAIMEAIKRNPDRVLIRDDELHPVGTGVPSRRFYANPFLHSRGWSKIERSESKAFYIPQEIAITKKYDSTDTPANRFIKYAFIKFDDICVRLKDSLLALTNSAQAECLNEAEAIHLMIEEILNDDFFDDIDDLDIMPQNNQVLQKREGYAQIFAAYSMVDLALQLDWKGNKEVYDGESKNVALLYEYWLFFELNKIISSIEGCKLSQSNEDSFISTVDGGVTISLSEGKKSKQSYEIDGMGLKVNLYYNRTFSRTEFSTTRYEGSYSRPFRPDYTLAIFPSYFEKGPNNGENEAMKNGEVSFVHFDAKYRVTELTALIGKNDEVSEEELIEDKTNSVINSYKRGDLLKMHTYNDAIRRTIGSFVLYPGKTEKSNKAFSLYDEILPGVGAFAIRPSIDNAGEKELREFITALFKSKSANSSRLNRMHHYMEMVLREPSVNKPETNTSGNSNKEKRDSQLVIGYLRAEKEEDYYNYLVENALLKNDKSFLFYFYAIKDGVIYSHHPDVFNKSDFCFYINDINEGIYRLEPVLCRIESNEMLTKKQLVTELNARGFNTSEESHLADYYYVLTIRVVDDSYESHLIDVVTVNKLNGNDAYSPHSPMVITWKDI